MPLRRVVVRPVVFFAVLVRLDVDRDLLVPEVDRARLVPELDRGLVVPDDDRDRLVDDVERFAAVARPPLAPAAFFCAVLPPRLDVDRDVLEPARDRDVPDVERDRELPVERDLLVPDVDRARLVPELDRDFAAVARPPLAPAAFFCAVLPPRLEAERDDPLVERLRLVVERDELRDVPELRDVLDFEREPELLLLLPVDRDLELLDDRRGDAARARETGSSWRGSSATDSAPKRSGMKPALIGGSGVEASSRLSSSK